MHDLLSFMPRPRMKTRPPSTDIQHVVNALVNDVQVLVAHDRGVVLRVLAQFAHEERLRLPRAEQKEHEQPR
jgi:hypothetical protein